MRSAPRGERILLTGATGIVGCEIARELLRRADPPEIIALLRGSDEDIALKARWLRQWAGVDADRTTRLETVRGDMTQPTLGLSRRDLERVESVTGILHAGAVTRFDQTASAAFANNVDSTCNLLALARRCRRLERIGIVSTAFVAGRRRGTVGEDELDLEVEFNNEYERSKALAEHAARRAMADLPIAVYRLAIVVGRRSDGCVSRLAGLYPMVRLFHEGLLAMFPGEARQRVDLVPSDLAAAAICHLFGAAFVSSRTYHVCAGADRSFAVEELFPAIDEYLSAADPAWRGRGQPLPLPVPADVFRNFVDIVALTGNRRLQRIIRQSQAVSRQLEVPKTFDTHRFDAAVRGVDGLALAHARSWLQPSIARAVATDWRRPARGCAP